jgi:hypothetical protein
MKRALSVALAIVTPLVAAVAQVAPPLPKSDVPVTTVVLFSSGVGYFEHGGTVHGTGATELRFKASQMNDVLKSLVLQDEDGGKVGTITYPSQDPLSKTLRSFQVDITSNPSMAQLLNQLRGAKVTIQSQAERISGTILGVETRTRSTDKDAVVDAPVVNVLSGATIRSVELQAISGLTLDDPELQDELAKALSALSQSRDQDKKPVTINFTGTGDRRIRIGYVVETPIWKTSYRLLLGDKGAMLQGWAIVENQTESDWNNVSLSLVSGRPISFLMDLYSPLYLTRPTVQLEQYESLRPQSYAGGVMADSVVRSELRLRSPTEAAVAMAPGRGGRRIGYDINGQPLTTQLNEVVVTAASALDAASSIEAAAQAGKLGELFQYTVHNVTLARQKSAMIPIVTDSIGVERVSIYNAGVLATNPLNGVRLTNTTGKNLLQGPVTVLDKSSYAGDATIDNLPAGQERLLSYGIDLDVLVNSQRNTQSAVVTSGKIVKGVLSVDRKYVSSQDYVADNKSDKAKILVIEHPIKQGWKFVDDTPKPFEVTLAVSRFRVPLPAKKGTTLTIKEESVRSEGLSVLAADPTVLLQYSRTGEFPQAVRDALGKVIGLKQAVADVDRDIAARTQRIADITVEQNRIRENMKTVGQTSDYYQRLLGKLNDQESSIEALQHERDELLIKHDAVRKDLESYVNGLNVG